MMTDPHKENCHFCGLKTSYLPAVGISLSMGGDDYAFCRKCLRSMTADQFWRKIFKERDYCYPPNLKSQE